MTSNAAPGWLSAWVPTYIDAHCTPDEMQAAVSARLPGEAALDARSPIDPLCGLEDAK